MMALIAKFRGTLLLAALFTAQTIVTMFVASGRQTPLAVPLESFPALLANRWTVLREDRMSDMEAKVLRADHVLLRTYAAGNEPDIAPISLMVAYFEAQVEGRAPHSPKNCLPGAGFEPVETGIVKTAGFPVNRYLLALDERRILMLYWYQSGRRAIASEYEAKAFLVSDALFHRRTESMIVRVSVPLQHAGDTRTEEEALSFVRAVQPAVLAHLSK